MELIRGRWSKKYINCWEDKRDYDIMRRAFMHSHEKIASDYCDRLSLPDLSIEEKKQIFQYWAQYGIRIHDFNWHRMYYHITNNHDPRFIPDLVAGLVVYEYYNNSAHLDTWRDKNMLHRLLPGLPLPKTLGRKIRGRYYHDELGAFTEEDIIKFAQAIWDTLGQEDDIIIKNALHSDFAMYHIKNAEDILNLLAQYRSFSDFIIQLSVRPHEVIASLKASSSNIIRICSWRHGNQVDIVYSAARVTAANSFADDNLSKGDKHINFVGISEDGALASKMLDPYGRTTRFFLEKVEIPSWEKIIETIKKNHLLVDNFDMIGWDFTVDENGNPVCLDWNIEWPGTVLYQIANSRPLFGNKTDEVLSFLKDEKNRDNYIPYYMRIKK